MTDSDPEETILGKLIPSLLNTLLPADVRGEINGTEGVALDTKQIDVRPVGMGNKLRLIVTNYSNTTACTHAIS